MNIFVAGATGQTGRHIVKQLADKKDVAVKALVRNLDRAKEILPSQAEFIQGDVLKPETFANALFDCSVLICATGATPSLDPTEPYKIDYQGTKNLVNAGKAAGIEHFILISSLCVSKFFHPLNLFWLVLYWKKQAESYIQASGIDYTIVRPGGLKNDDNSSPIIMTSADQLLDGSIPRQKVAQVCVEAVFESQAKFKIVEVIDSPDGPVITYSELFGSII